MSRSSNVRSRYQRVPEHIRVSVSVQDSGAKRRSKDSRAKDKHVFINSIRKGDYNA